MGTGGLSGEAVYLYLPGHGRYAMSLARVGTRGEVHGSRITFRNGNDNWSVDCDCLVAPGGGVFNLYVYRDPAWRATTSADTLPTWS
jgi:hypothetical protein